MPKKTPYPKPVKRWHNGAWQIIWRWNGKQFSVSTGMNREKEDAVFADVLLRQTALALAKDAPDFPRDIAGKPGTIRYVSSRYGQSEGMARDGILSKPDKWLDDYADDIGAVCSRKWADISLRYLGKLEVALDGLQNATTDKVSKYLAGIAARRSMGTRNRTHNAFSRFFKWTVTTGRLLKNPMEGLKRAQEKRLTNIVYCTPAERDECIDLAKATGWPEWIAVPIAFYSGMRREEIANLKWPDVRFREGSIVVIKTKTSTSRTLPMNMKLEKYLSAIPEAGRVGYVVPSREDFNRLSRLNVMMLKMRNIKAERILRMWK
jgi:integrase